MTNDDVRRQRCANQRLCGTGFGDPAEAVRWLGGVQSQEFALAKWAVAQRCADPAAAMKDLTDAIAEGTILRTHVLRPTWHFVHRDDIRWLLELTGPRVQARAQHRHRELGITAAMAAASTHVIAAALEGGTHLTRRGLAAVLERSGISTEGQIIAHLIMHAELEAVICSGAPRGKQQTYALLEERAPDSAWLPREEAVAELTARYFMSHGPATLRDFQWWSTLTLSDIHAGVRAAGGGLEAVHAGARTYWMYRGVNATPSPAPIVQVIHQFDEYLVGYAESRSIMDAAGRLPPGETLSRLVLIDGDAVGRWRRNARSRAVEIELLRPLSRVESRALDVAVEAMTYATA